MYLGVIVSATSLYFKENQPLFVGNSMIKIFGNQGRQREDMGTGYFAVNGSDERGTWCLLRMSKDQLAGRLKLFRVSECM